MHYLTDKHYTLTSLGKRLTLQSSLYFYETLSHMQSNLFLRTSSWVGRCMTPASTGKLYVLLWSHLTWNITCPKKAICFATVMLYKLFIFPCLHFSISFSWEFQIILCSRLRQKFHVRFLKVGHENGRATIMSWTCRMNTLLNLHSISKIQCLVPDVESESPTFLWRGQGLISLFQKTYYTFHL